MTPSADVALRMLQALGIVDKQQARDALLIWCRPSPRLSVLDVTQILEKYPAGADRGTETFDQSEFPPRAVAPRSGEHDADVPYGQRRPRLRTSPTTTDPPPGGEE